MGVPLTETSCLDWNKRWITKYTSFT